MSAPAPEQDPLIGTTLRSYQILEQIGVSRWGKVYRAFQSSMDRIVAVRVLSAEIAAMPGKTEQFLEESRDEAQLAHPYLVILYEAGQADGTSFCAMEYLDGPPLAEFLRNGDEVDEHRLLQTIVGVARALDFLWQRKIPHQPPLDKNVLTTTEGSVKLINIAPVEMPASQSPQEDILKLGLMVASVANDIAPVSKPVSKFVERMLGSPGGEPFASLTEAADAAERLDRELFLPAGPLDSEAEQTEPMRVQPAAMILMVGFLALLLAAAGWLLWRMLRR